MWGGFDLSAATKQLGALGSQLGEAIEKAKHEVVSTIDSFEKGDDYVPPSAGPNATAVQPPSNEPRQDFQLPHATLLGQTAPPLQDEAQSAPELTEHTEVKASKPKKKIIKKIIRKVPAAHDGGTAAASAASTSTRTSDAGSAQQSAHPQPQQVLQPAEQQHQHEEPLQQEHVQVQELGLGNGGWGTDGGWGDADGVELDLQLESVGQNQQQDHQSQQKHRQDQQQWEAPEQGQEQLQLQQPAPEQVQLADSSSCLQENQQGLQQQAWLQPAADLQQPPQHADASLLPEAQQWDGAAQQQLQEQEHSWELKQQQQEWQQAVDTGQLDSGEPNAAALGTADACDTTPQLPAEWVQSCEHEPSADAASAAAAAAAGTAGTADASSWDDSSGFAAAAAAAPPPDSNGNHVQGEDFAQGEMQDVQQQQEQQQQQDTQHLQSAWQEAREGSSTVQDMQQDPAVEQQQDQQQSDADATQRPAADEHHVHLQQQDVPHPTHEQQHQQQRHQPNQHAAQLQQVQPPAADDFHQQPSLPMSTIGSPSGEQKVFAELQQQLAAREEQLSRAAGRLSDLESTVAQLTESKADLEVVVQQLTEANEHLALRAAKVSEAELQEVQQEATDRLAAAERKVFALTKERDALKRAAAAASAGGDTAAEAAALRGQLHRKDELVSQLMDEGQKLSKRQLELEGNVKKLRQQLKASEAEREKLSALLAAETSEAEGLRRAKAKAERDLVAAVEAGRQEVEAVRQQAQADMLSTQAEQAAAQATAAQAATGELASALKAAESRNAALTESLGELQEALERQRAAADLREEMLRQDLADVEKRAQAAENRHQELSAKLPEATAPLLRQISALQDASSAQAQAWAAAERSLASRLRDAEANAAAAAAREAAAQEALGALQVRVAAAEASAAAAKSAGSEAATRAARAEERFSIMQTQLDEQLSAASESQSLILQLREDVRAAESAAARRLELERSVRRAAEEELGRTRAELEALQRQGPGVTFGGLWGGPPAMAAPGFKWVLVSEAEDGSGGAAGFAGGNSLTRRLSSISSQPGVLHRMSTAGLLDEELAAVGVGGASGGSHQGSEAAGLFDPGELFAAGQQGFAGAGGVATPAYTPRAGDAASAASQAGGYAGAALGSPTGSIASSRAQQSAQARMVAARLGGGGTVAEAAVQRLRAALRQKAGECASMEGRLRELEATRDQLATELVKATHRAEQAADSLTRLPQLQAEYQELEQRYAAAVELLGERDEQLEELAADLADVKQLYKQQIEALVAQLAQAGTPVQG